MTRSILFCAVIFLCAACMQSQPAQVSLRGNEVFARGGGLQMLESAAGGSRAMSTAAYATPAGTSAIAVSDLAPAAGPKKSGMLSWLDREPRNNDPRNGSGLIWPVHGEVISSFGSKGGGRLNEGINIAATTGEPVFAVAAGEAIYVGNEVESYGTMVILRHSDGRTTSYAHLSRPYVEKYERVAQGQVIGYVGATGEVRESQLHFEVREDKRPLNPLTLLPRQVAQR